MTHPQLVVFDLDGTLAESKQALTLEMGALLARLLAKIPVAVMSGDSWAHFNEKLLDELPDDAELESLYLFPTNAGQCLAFKDGVWQKVYSQAFTEEEKAAIHKALKECLAEVGLSEPPAQLWGERIEERDGVQVSFSPLGQSAPVPEKEAWKAAHDSLRSQLRDLLEERLPGLTVKTGGLTTIDIMKSGITKAYGVKQLSGITGIPVSEMLYVGDALEPGGNDAVVIETGIPVHKVTNPRDTAALIEELVNEEAALA